MTRHLIRVVVSACALLVAASAVQAQEQVTVVRRNGDAVSGRFEAWTRATGTVYIRVSQPDQRKLPMADLMLIDVGGNGQNLPAREREMARGGDHVLVTRGGEVLRGKLVNIEGGEGSENEADPRTVSFQAGGERRFRLSEVARIYLGNFTR